MRETKEVFADVAAVNFALAGIGHEEAIRRSFAFFTSENFFALLLGVFGGIALVLAVVGVNGVKAYAVARRTREIGIRMALGAQPGNVLRMILREGAVMLAAEIAIGFALAVATGRIVSGLLYQVGALDPIAFTIAPLVLAAATLLACWLPARRATRVDPLTALRTE